MKMRAVLIGVLVLALAAGAFAYERTVMVEYFSNYACGPCYGQDGNVQILLDNYSRDDVAFMIYHVNWPGPNDWYYVANSSQNNTRRGYYGVDGVPWFQVDGYTNSGNLGYLMGTITNRIGEYTPVQITFDSGQIVEDHVEVEVTVASDVDLSATDRLHTLLIDLDTPYGIAPNGITNYRYNMLEMAPSASGQGLNIPAGGSETFTFTMDLWDDHELDNYGVVSFVQNNGDSEIYQSRWTDEIEIPYPNLSVTDTEIDDDGQALPNGRPDAGETVEIIVSVDNAEDYNATEGLTATITASDPALEFDHAECSFPVIPPGGSGSNADDPFVMTVPDPYSAKYVTFTVTFSDGSGYETSHDFLQLVGAPPILFVNDYGNGEDAYDTWFDVMVNAELAFEFKSPEEVMEGGAVGYDAVIWATSNSTGDVLSSEKRAAIANYLNSGGKLLLTGENIGQSIGDASFLADYFGSQHGNDEQPSPYNVRLFGVEDGPFPDADLTIFGAGGADNSVEPSSVIPIESVPFYHYVQAEDIGGVGYETGTFSSVYLAFNLEAVSGLDNSQTADEVVLDLLQWMDVQASVDHPGAQPALPETVELAGYPNPFNARITVSWSLPAAGEIELAVYNLLGQEVARLAEGRMNAGVHDLTWDASGQASGVYLLALTAGGRTHTNKIVLMK